MSIALAQRAVALAAIALLAAIAALALSSRTSDSDRKTTLPQPVPAVDGGWYQALAAPRRAPDGAQRTVCGHDLTPRTMGIAHPVLPCGAKLFISYGGVEVLTQVVARGPTAAGRQFALTDALARKVGLEGVDLIRWRFARP